jgi:hypothetical protein
MKKFEEEAMTDEKAKGHPVRLSQKPKSWDDFFDSPKRVMADFMTERVDPPPPKRVQFD